MQWSKGTWELGKWVGSVPEVSRDRLARPAETDRLLPVAPLPSLSPPRSSLVCPPRVDPALALAPREVDRLAELRVPGLVFDFFFGFLVCRIAPCSVSSACASSSRTRR